MPDKMMEIQSHKGPYRVYFDDNALEKLDSANHQGLHYIIDRKVAALYREQMEHILSSESVLLIDATEDNKALDVFPAYVQHLVAKRIRKDHRLCAIGGGVTQDITCFLAATMLRGVEWVFYPTTLLAQTDSCIGSKSSINAGSAKNILGTFTPPEKVFISTRFLSTLDPVDVRSGVGEMVKVHVIDGPASFDSLASSFDNLFEDPLVMMRFIMKSLEIKQAYIEKDEFDIGPRRVFNYGHSFGHAIEAATHFAVPHGIAVTIGADMANYVAWKLGVGSEANFHRMHLVLKRNYCGFESIEIPFEPFITAIGKDKKNVGMNHLTLILPDHDGRVGISQYENNEQFREICVSYLDGQRFQ